MRFFALTDEPDFTVARPLSLLRRPGGSGPLEYLGRDGAGWPDLRPGLVSGDDLRQLVEVDADQAAALAADWTEGAA